MPVNEAFLQAILEDPEDDAVRLIYAYWLQENAQPAGAEVIRVQIALAGLHPGDPRWEPLAEREEELLREHRERWTAELTQRVLDRLGEADKESLCKHWKCTPADLPRLFLAATWGWWRRGFIDEIRRVAPRGVAGAVLAVAPLRRLSLTDWCSYTSLAGSPLLARLRELAIRIWDHSEMHGGQFEDGDLEEVLRCPEIRNLTHLELEGYRLSPAGMRTL